MHLQGRDFTIVFRSFGNDIAEVMEEMNMFCTGQHPFHPEVNPVGLGGVALIAFSALYSGWHVLFATSLAALLPTPGGCRRLGTGGLTCVSGFVCWLA